MPITTTGAGASGVWTPASLPSLAITLLPALSRQQSKLWQDASKTVAATADGDLVRVATCPFTGRDFTAPSDAARPTLRVSGGLWYLNFDGFDDQLAAGDLSVHAPTEGTIGWRMEDLRSPASNMSMGQTRSNDSLERTGLDALPGLLRTSRTFVATGALGDGLRTVVYRSSASRYQRRNNGTADLTAAAGYGSPTNVVAGASLVAPYYFLGPIRGMVLCGADVNDATAALLEAYLGAL